MRLPTITGEFRIAADPELRYTASGSAVAGLVLIATESKRNDADTGWDDGDTTGFVRASIWNSRNGGTEAEQVTDMFVKGERVLVSGLLFVREFDRNDGTKGQSVEIKYATVGKVAGGMPRGNDAGQQRNSQGRQGQQRQGRQQAPQVDDPWSTPAGGGDPWS